MGKKKADMVKVEAGPRSVPVYMKSEDVMGVEDLSQYVLPPRVKVVQNMSKALLEDFCLGDCVVVPNGVMLAEMSRDDKGKPTGESDGFTFIPLLFFAEWCTWNPIGTIPAIRDRSFDPNSAIAVKSQNPNLRSETMGDGVVVRHCEHLNFVVLLKDSAVTDPCIMSFARAEHRAGRQFCNLVKMRRAPLYGCVFKADINLRENDQGSWWGIDITNPSEGAWVEEGEFNIMKTLHLDLKRLSDESKIRAAYDEGDLPGPNEGDVTGSEKF